MPRTNCISIDLTRRDLSEVESRLLTQMKQPMDDIPLIGSIGEAIAVIRSNHAGSIGMRIEDDPGVILVWDLAGKTAIIYTLRRWRLQHIDLVLLGEDTSILSRVRGQLRLLDNEVRQIEGKSQPLLVRCRVRRRTTALVEILALIAYVPIMCELHSVE